jgi:HD-GYP domain-containing protein (c-di-GMP phosphodiesterase class II)
MSTAKPFVVPARSCRLAMALYFEGDDVAYEALGRCGRVQHASVESSDPLRLSSENVYVVGDEAIMELHIKRLRAPNVRVIALSDRRFREPRTDGAVYAYLPLETPAALLERMFDNAVDHMHLAATRRETTDKLALAHGEIHELNQIGAALSAEHNSHKLLELILTKCREITHADAGSIYLVEDDESGEEQRPAGDTRPAPKRLCMKLAQNDSVTIPFREARLPVNEHSIAGYVADHGSVVMVEDAYALEKWVTYAINKQFDSESGYRTRSILAVAMKNPKNEVVGVVQLINAKRDRRVRLTSPEDVETEVVPFTTRQMEIVSSLTSQAAVAYENSLLYDNIQRLFEGFVKASVNAIEQRDPTTAGHSFRVANLTVALAEAVDRDGDHYRDVKFSRSEMREIRYASLLHDFGKVGVREEVLTKSHKLYPQQMELITTRFDFARRTLQAEASERKLRYLLDKGREQYMAAQPHFDAELEERLKELDHFALAIRDSNRPTVMPENPSEWLDEIVKRAFPGFDGKSHPLLTCEEVRLLSIRKGSLDDEERAEVESHVERTYQFLKQIPWTREIRNIPEIARGHHEKLNGTGYPRKLASFEIPLPTRLMTVSDIFDALAAADRPYKSAVSVERALEILGQMSDDGEIDRQVYTLFVDSKIYDRWKVDCFAY